MPFMNGCVSCKGAGRGLFSVLCVCHFFTKLYSGFGKDETEKSLTFEVDLMEVIEENVRA